MNIFITLNFAYKYGRHTSVDTYCDEIEINKLVLSRQTQSLKHVGVIVRYFGKQDTTYVSLSW